jgi:hypothetical protein
VMCEQGRRGGVRGLCVKAWTSRGKEGARPGPRDQCQFQFKPIFQTEQDLIRSKTGFLLIKNFQIKYGFVGN